MVAATAGLLRMQTRKGFMGSQAVLQILAAAESLCGRDECTRLQREAALFRLPDGDEAVREDKVARLHQAVRRSLPAQAATVLRLAGQGTADHLVEHRISERAQKLLGTAPRPVAAWMLGRWAKQNVGTIAGSAILSIHGTTGLELKDNPLVRGEQARAPVCDYHAALFERLFQRLVDPRLICREILCAATGASSCRFEIGFPEDDWPGFQPAV